MKLLAFTLSLIWFKTNNKTSRHVKSTCLLAPSGTDGQTDTQISRVLLPLYSFTAFFRAECPLQIPPASVERSDFAFVQRRRDYSCNNPTAVNSCPFKITPNSFP